MYVYVYVTSQQQNAFLPMVITSGSNLWFQTGALTIFGESFKDERKPDNVAVYYLTQQHLVDTVFLLRSMVG